MNITKAQNDIFVFDYLNTKTFAGDSRRIASHATEMELIEKNNGTIQSAVNAIIMSLIAWHGASLNLLCTYL